MCRNHPGRDSEESESKERDNPFHQLEEIDDSEGAVANLRTDIDNNTSITDPFFVLSRILLLEQTGEGCRDGGG